MYMLIIYGVQDLCGESCCSRCFSGHERCLIVVMATATVAFLLGLLPLLLHLQPDSITRYPGIRQDAD